MIEWKKGYAVSGNVMVLKKITKVGGRQVISRRIVWTGGVNSCTRVCVVSYFNRISQFRLRVSFVVKMKPLI